MNSIGIIISILSISICILLAIVFYNKTTRWITAIIVPALCVAAYLGWNSAEDLKGRATKNVYADRSLFLGSSASPPKSMYVWIQPLDAQEPLLMVLPYSESLALRMAQANKDLCEGKPQGVKGVPINGQGDNEDTQEGRGHGDDLTLEIYDFNILVRPTK